MAKIYSSVQSITKPEFKDGMDWTAFDKQEEEYVAKVKAYAKKYGHGPDAGKEVAFGVADGSARYIVYSLKPVELIHLAVGDAYNFPYVNRLTVKDIRDRISGDEALEGIFRPKASKVS